MPRIISPYDYDENILMWKYRGKISGGLFKNRVSVSLGFEAAVKLINGALKPVYESEDFRRVSDIFFVRMRTERFIVLNSTELVRELAGLGDEIKISYFLDLVNKSPSLNRIIRWE